MLQSTLISALTLPAAWGLALQPRQNGGPVGLPPEVEKSPPPPEPVPAKAPELDKRFQPALDFDTDSCYNCPAIDSDGNLSAGQTDYGLADTSFDCHYDSMLDKAQVYSRQRCNGDFCAIMYAYYFQKDSTGSFSMGHTHDWEHVVVWVRKSDNFVTHVAISQHKGYDIRDNAGVWWTGENGHPAVIYHKDQGLTHAFRWPNDDDMASQENAHGQWIYGPLVSHHGWDSVGLRDKMYNNNWDHAQLAINDDHFADNLGKAKPGDIEFDVNTDDEHTNSFD